MDDSDFSPTQEQENPTYNSTFTTLDRVHMWLSQANLAQRENNPIEWRQAIMIVYKEIRAYLSPERKKYHDEQIAKIEVYYAQYITYANNFQSNISKINGTRFMPPRAIFDALYRWEIELREEPFVQKILLKREEGAGRAML